MCDRKIGPFDCCSVVQGDCRELLKDVRLPSGSAIITDPPYGISLANHDKDVEASRKFGWKIDGDKDQVVGNRILTYLEKFPTIAFASPKKPWGGDWNQHLVWWKGPAVGGGGDTSTYWKMDWELVQARNLGVLMGNRDSSVISEWITPQSSPHHPCEKPESLMLYLVGKVAAETIIDPFCGSGTTLVAAKKLGRHFLGFEISPEYCDIARKRIAAVEAQPTLFAPRPEQMTLEVLP